MALADLRRLDLGTVKEIVGTFIGSADTLAKATRAVAAVTDDRPLQEYGVRSVLTPVTGGPAALGARRKGVRAASTASSRQPRPRGSTRISRCSMRPIITLARLRQSLGSRYSAVRISDGDRRWNAATAHTSPRTGRRWPRG